MQESGAHVVVAEEDYSPYARQRDRQVAEALPLRLTGGLVVYPPEAVLKADRSPYTVFTPFSRRWKALPPPRTSSVLRPPARVRTPDGLHSLPIPTPPFKPPFPAGPEQASARLNAFIDGPKAPIYEYSDMRDRMDLGGTSQLSPYLRFGMLSARQAVVSAHCAIHAARDPKTRSAAEAWLNELIWREFYLSILYHFPQVRRRSFRPHLRAMAWRNDEDEFLTWTEGRTGYPMVDAAMRQLVATGWMPNRARMVVASFLTKDLLIDWRWGERFFMQHLVDGDPAANNGGWQWTAGTGTDAAPYFRIFNPVTQGKEFDPDGAYVRTWVPELKRIPDRFIHKPWKMPLDEQRAAGCVVGRDYPPPIVDHGQARQLALRRYDQAKKQHKQESA
jgi:deoxyribodipyrimidine photo-lyase